MVHSTMTEMMANVRGRRGLAESENVIAAGEIAPLKYEGRFTTVVPNIR